MAITNLFDRRAKKFRLLTVPKSGTHLLGKVLSLMGYENAHNPPHHIGKACPEDLKKYLDLNPKTKFLFLVRDPRDVFVSLVHHIDKLVRRSSIDPNDSDTHFERCQEKQRAWLNDYTFDEKLMKVITTDMSCGYDFKVMVHWQWDCALWLNNYLDRYPNTVMLKFEELVGTQGGSDDEVQKFSIEKIAHFMNVKLKALQVEDIQKKLFGNKFPLNDNTFRKGQIGAWKNYFKPDHIDAFKKHWDHLLLRFNYEQDLDWEKNYTELLTN